MGLPARLVYTRENGCGLCALDWRMDRQAIVTRLVQPIRSRSSTAIILPLGSLVRD
jgi:hypothetical protein